MVPSPAQQQRLQMSDEERQSLSVHLNSRVDASTKGYEPSRLILADASAKRRKRIALAPRNEDVFLKRRKHTHNRAAHQQMPPRLTNNNLVQIAKSFNAVAASFDGDAKARAMQEAGRQMGFHLRLECYEQAATNIRDWIRSPDTLFGERPIFKDLDDVVTMNKIAKSFEIALAQSSEVQCQA